MVDLLKTIEDNRTSQEEELKKKQMKEELEQLYGYDSEKEEDEASMASKFMATLEKIREKRRQQMQKMV